MEDMMIEIIKKKFSDKRHLLDEPEVRELIEHTARIEYKLQKMEETVLMHCVSSKYFFPKNGKPCEEAIGKIYRFINEMEEIKGIE